MGAPDGFGVATHLRIILPLIASEERPKRQGLIAGRPRGEDGATRDHHITVLFEPAPNLVVRISVQGEGPHGGPKPHPRYGDQLQIFGVKGVLPAEGSFKIELHDGRARNFTEAILWHSGEALAAGEIFRQLARQEREALLAFLQSL